MSKMTTTNEWSDTRADEYSPAQKELVRKPQNNFIEYEGSDGDDEFARIIRFYGRVAAEPKRRTSNTGGSHPQMTEWEQLAALDHLARFAAGRVDSVDPGATLVARAFVGAMHSALTTGADNDRAGVVLRAAGITMRAGADARTGALQLASDLQRINDLLVWYPAVDKMYGTVELFALATAECAEAPEDAKAWANEVLRDMDDGIGEWFARATVECGEAPKDAEAWANGVLRDEAIRTVALSRVDRRRTQAAQEAELRMRESSLKKAMRARKKTAT